MVITDTHKTCMFLQLDGTAREWLTVRVSLKCHSIPQCHHEALSGCKALEEKCEKRASAKTRCVDPRSGSFCSESAKYHFSLGTGLTTARSRHGPKSHH